MTFLIVGAGEAGVAAAGALREQGRDGRILVVGAELHPPYARPPLSKAVLTDAQVAPEPIRTAAWLADRNIEVRLGAEISALDPSTQDAVLVDAGGSEQVRYDRMLLATGARVRRLAALDVLGACVAYLRTYDDSLALRERLARARSVAIIGGGVIGLEVASSARRLGCEVIVIEPADRLMARAMSACGSQMLLDLHRRGGVDVRLGIGLQSAEPLAEGARLTLTDGQVIEVDTVVAAVGVDPDDRLARAMGCATDNGVLVDPCCETSIANVFAAGDVARFTHPVFDGPLRVEAWQHARKHGAHAARAMLGDRTPYAEIPWFWTDQHGVNVQVAGVPGYADGHVGRGATTLHLKGDRLVAATTVDNARDMRACINLIAAGWRGPAAVLADTARSLASLAAEAKRV